MERKLLIAIDGSVYSSNSLHYLERLFAGMTDIRIHLLSVIPCYTSQVAKEWFGERDLLGTLSKEEQKGYAAANRYLKQAVERLARNNISSEQISTEIKITAASPADEIIRIARNGMFDALVIGRRGISKLEELIMGTVSGTVFEKCHDIPIWIVDGQVDSRKFLLPVDGSHFTLQAADHLSFILKDNPYAEVTLFYSAAMFAQKQELSIEYCKRYLASDWCTAHIHDKDFYFLAPRQMLINNGFSPERIHLLETKAGMYPSRQIVRQAVIDDFGTIVIGRRGKEIKRGVFGSVTEKVVAMSLNAAVWVVG